MPTKAKTSASSRRNGTTSKPSPKAVRHTGTPIEEIATGRTNLFTISWHDAEPAPVRPGEKIGKNGDGRFNTREDFSDIFEFAESLAPGVRGPLRGYLGANGKFQITDGERRWRGAKILAQRGIKVDLPIIREPKGYSEVDRNLDLIRMNSGKPLSMLEQAHAFQRVLALGVPEKELHKKAGCSPTHITNCLALLQTAPEVQAAVAKGEMSGTLAADLQRAVPDPEKQKEIIRQGRDNAKPAPSGKKKITAKNLPVATGKKAAKSRSEKQTSNAQRSTSNPQPQQAQRSTSNPQPQQAIFGQPVIKPTDRISGSSGESPAPPRNSDPILARLDDLQDSVTNADADKGRLETLEFIGRYLRNKETLTSATKFILGMI
jgi:ParB/RepB/Spo0J family partition protein